MQNRAIGNIKAVLEAAGSSMDKIISRRIYIINMKDLALVDRIWARYLRAPHPASSSVQVEPFWIKKSRVALMEGWQVAGLAKEGALVEIEVIAEC